MKKLLLLPLLLILIQSAFATHTYGGYISYRHLRGTTYGVEVVLFQDANSPAIERREIAIDWGDGSGIDSINVTFETPVGNGPFSNIIKRTYTGNHTYPSATATYTISIEDPNRVHNIANMSNSVNQPVYLSSTIRIVPFVGSAINYSVTPESNLLVTAEVGEEVNLNLAAVDDNADYLTYNLTQTKATNGQVAVGYTLPPDAAIDLITGEFTWTPTAVGLYQFTAEVTECRNNEFIAKTSVDFMVTVLSSNNRLEFTNLNPADTNIAGNLVYQIAPGDSMEAEFILKGFGSDADKIKIDLKEETNRAILTDSTISSDEKKYTLKWVSTSTDLRCPPYLFTLTATNETIEKDFSVLAIVKDTALLNCDTLCGYGLISLQENSKAKNKLTVYPNPSASSVTFEFNETINEQVKIQVYSVTGKLILEESKTNVSKFIIDNTRLKKGTYFYRISTRNNLLKNGKVIFH